jgi:shikimate dehydrogenase
MKEIKGTTKLVGLIGWPVDHSLSPQMHNAAFADKGLDFCYVAFPVMPASLKEAVRGLRALGMVGANVTIPHKEKVLAYLDEASAEAQAIGAVNTILIDENRLFGYNTDAMGFLTSLEQEANVRLEGKHVVVIGAGGAGRAMSVGAAFSRVRQVTLCDIVLDKAERLAATIRAVRPEVKTAAMEPTSEQFAKSVKGADIVVNATPLGMRSDDPLPLDPDHLSKETFVFDAIYIPAETQLLKAAREKGCRTLSGIGMLVHQGAAAFKIWTAVEPNIALMREVVNKALGL